jgi:hypothetical protein
VESGIRTVNGTPGCAAWSRYTDVAGGGRESLASQWKAKVVVRLEGRGEIATIDIYLSNYPWWGVKKALFIALIHQFIWLFICRQSSSIPQDLSCSFFYLLTATPAIENKPSNRFVFALACDTLAIVNTDIKLYRVWSCHHTFHVVTAESIFRGFDTYLIFDQAIHNKAYSSHMWP